MRIVKLPKSFTLLIQLLLDTAFPEEKKRALFSAEGEEYSTITRVIHTPHRGQLCSSSFSIAFWVSFT